MQSLTRTSADQVVMGTISYQGGTETLIWTPRLTQPKSGSKTSHYRSKGCTSSTMCRLIYTNMAPYTNTLKGVKGIYFYSCYFLVNRFYLCTSCVYVCNCLYVINIFLKSEEGSALQLGPYQDRGRNLKKRTNLASNIGKAKYVRLNEA